jgi:hypothetical protein
MLRAFSAVLTTPAHSQQQPAVVGSGEEGEPAEHAQHREVSDS